MAICILLWCPSAQRISQGRHFFYKLQFPYARNLREGTVYSSPSAETLFLLDRTGVGDHYSCPQFDFKPYDFGPFDAEVYKELERLSNADLVEISYDRTGLKHFRLTAAGQQSANEVFAQLDERSQVLVTKVSDRVRKQTFTSLISTFFRLYPDKAVGSVEKEMTVVLGVLCRDGLVVDSDGASSSIGREFIIYERRKQKIWISQHGALGATSGKASVGQRMKVGIDRFYRDERGKELRFSDPVDLGDALRKRVLAERKDIDLEFSKPTTC